MSTTRWVPDEDVDHFVTTDDADVADEFELVDDGDEFELVEDGDEFELVDETEELDDFELVDDDEPAINEPEPAVAAVPASIVTVDDTSASLDEDDDDEDLEEPVAVRGEVPAWAISLGVHVLVLGVLAMVAFEVVDPRDIMLTSVVEQVDPQEYKLDSTVVDQIGNDSQINTLSASQASALQQGLEPQKKIEEVLRSDVNPKPVPLVELNMQPNQNELIAAVDRTGTVEHPGGVEGAVDRVTMEIAGSLKRGKTLVVWLFDRSPSVNQRREAIATRFENVYRQLGMLEVGEDRALKTAVAAFGSRWELMTEKPVDDYRDVVDAVRNIQPDSSGVENVFTAAKEVAGRFKSYRAPTKNRREVMIIIVTDEAGSDSHPAKVEEAIDYLRRKSMRAYVVGNAAPFGKKEVEIPWEYQGEMVTAVLEPGPETFLPERLQLPFWTINTRDLRQMSSGFGPYALTRLCVETGGMYLVTADTRGPRFDPAVMKNYQPDYSMPKNYVAGIGGNKAKVALMQAIAKFDPSIKRDPVMTAMLDAVLKEANVPSAFAYAQLGNVNVPGMLRDFPAENDNVLRGAITEAQRPIAVFDDILRQMGLVLLQHEKERKEIVEPRWRANYDLAAGRLLALRVRAYGYNKVLAEMKSTPRSFENKGSNRWRLKPSRMIDAGPEIKKMAKKADEYLRRVIDEHAGTPWALLAERELSQPMGWQWEEYRQPMVNTGRRAAPGNNNPRLQLADEERRRQQPMRPTRPPVPKRIKI